MGQSAAIGIYDDGSGGVLESLEGRRPNEANRASRADARSLASIGPEVVVAVVMKGRCALKVNPSTSASSQSAGDVEKRVGGKLEIVSL